MSTPKSRPAFDVVAINGTGDDARFFRIGAAFKREKGGFFISLDAAPLTNKLILQPVRAKDAPAEA